MDSRRILVFLVCLAASTSFLVGSENLVLQTERLVSTPLRAEFNYQQVLRCNLVNGGIEEAFGRLTIVDRFGNPVASTTFTLAPGHRASVDALTFNYDLRYCIADVGRFVDDVFNGNDHGVAAPVPVLFEPGPFVGSLQVVDGGITTATAALQSLGPVDCNDHDACTGDTFDPVAGECVNTDITEQLCGTDGVDSECWIECVSRLVAQERTFTVVLPRCVDVD